MDPGNVEETTLYYHPFSVRSAMVRYTIALRGHVGAGAVPIIVKEREVDIFEMEQLEEWFMFEVNPKGQVSSCHNDLILAYSCLRTGACAGQSRALGPPDRDS